MPTPPKRDLSMVYVEAFRHSTIVVRVELWVGQAALSPDAAALDDLEATTGAACACICDWVPACCVRGGVILVSTRIATTGYPAD